MNQEERDLLAEMLDLTRQNNKMLLGIKRSARIGAIFRVLRWVVTIGIAVGAYIYIQPYVQRILDLYSQTSQSVGTKFQQINSAIDKVNSVTNQINSFTGKGTSSSTRATSTKTTR